MSSKKRPITEVAAEAVLLRILGGTGGEYDHNQADSLFDFHLLDEAGRPRHAVEVTTANDEHLRRTGSRRARIAKKDLGLRVPWACAIAERAETLDVERRAPALLNALTHAGVTRFGSRHGRPAPAVATIVAELEALHIVDGWSFEPGEPRLYLDGWGGCDMDPLDITEAVEVELEKRDNRSKKGAHPGETRHLFVWIEGSKSSAYTQMLDVGSALLPLPPAPRLPPEFDVVWAAVADRDGNAAVLLRADADGFVEIDLTTGAPVPESAESFYVDGPPRPAADCPACGGPGVWRVDPDARAGGYRWWQSACAQDSEHWTGRGRRLSKLEESQLTKAV